MSSPLHIEMKELVGTDYWQDFNSVGTAHKNNEKVCRELSSQAIQAIELQKGCLNLRCPSAGTSFARYVEATCCLPDARWMGVHRHCAHLNMCFLVEADSNNCHYKCSSSTMCTYFGCSHKDIYAKNVSLPLHLQLPFGPLPTKELKCYLNKETAPFLRET